MKKEFLFVLLLVSILVISGCTQITKEKEQVKEEKFPLSKLTISILPFIPEDEVIERFQPLAFYLSSELGIPVDIKQYQLYGDLVDGLGKGEIDIAYFGPVTYVQAKEKYPKIELLVAGIFEGAPVYFSYIITAPESSISTVEDIKGKSFGFGSKDSTSSHLIPRLELKKSGIDVTDLKEYPYHDTHSEVIDKVLSGELDAGGVIDQLYEKNKDKLKVVKKSEPIPPFPFVLRIGVSPKAKEDILFALKKLSSSNPAHVAILKDMDKSYSGFTTVMDGDYTIIRDAMIEIYGSYTIPEE